MSLLDQLKDNLSPNLTVSEDLSFTPVKTSLALLYTKQMQVTKDAIANSVHTLLNLMTTEQLDRTIDTHIGRVWNNPLKGSKMRLCGITKEGNNWLLVFETAVLENHVGHFQAKELDINNVLTFLETIEQVLDTPKVNSFKS